MQQSSSLHSTGQLSKYGAGPLHPNFSNNSIGGNSGGGNNSNNGGVGAHHNHHPHHIIVSPKESFSDPLGIAERGKVGMPPSSSECSSNSSVEASVESNTGLVNGSKKGFYFSEFQF